jgi:CPA1 family monovalent cation:H+ antiporter
VFGALISTTDPISVAGVFRRLGAGRRLTLLIQAESLFNNDTAYVLFTIMMGLVGGGQVSPWRGIVEFVQLAGGGAVLGIAVGYVASRVHYEIDDHLVEITLTTIVAFGSYLSAQALHVSGVMAVIASGIVVANYGMQRAMSPSTRLAMTAFWEYLGFLVNSLVFVLIGIEVCRLDWTREWPVALGSAFIVLAGRAGIYPLSVLVNRVGGNVPRSWQHVLFWGGLRGSLSMALVLSLSPSFPYRETLIAATFGAVIFSLLIQGLSLGPLIRRLGLGDAVTRDSGEQRQLAAEIVAVRAAIDELERLRKLEAHPNWSIEFLMQDYRRRLAAAEDKMERLRPELKRDSESRAVQARRRALAAEKTALYESERQGWLDEEDWIDISRRIDAELAELAARADDKG